LKILKFSKNANDLNYEKAREGGGRSDGKDDVGEGVEDLNAAKAGESGPCPGGSDDVEDLGDRSIGTDEEDSEDCLPMAGRGWSDKTTGMGGKMPQHQDKDKPQRSGRAQRVQVVDGELEEPATANVPRRALFKRDGCMTEECATLESTHVPTRKMLAQVKDTLPCWHCKTERAAA
jgi:hypothetical protein